MSRFGAEDVAAMLEELGVLVTLGSDSTFGLVDAADEELLRSEGSPVAVLGRAVLVTIETGSLAGLTPGAAVTVAGVAHQVDRTLSAEDGELTRFLAYPSAAVAPPDFWSRGSLLLPWISRTTGADPGAAFDLDTLIGEPVLVLEAAAASTGTDPALNVKVQHCATAGGTFVDAGVAFAAIAEAGGLRSLVLDPALVHPFVRLVPTITGTGAPAFYCGAAMLDFMLPELP